MSHYEASSGPGTSLPRARGHVAESAGLRVSALGRTVPLALLILAGVAGLAWRDHGSPNPRDWLKYGVLAALVVSGIFLSGRASRPSRPALIALGALGGTAILATISITFTPVPNLARDEALLTLFYGAVFAVPALVLRRRRDRIYAVGAIVAGSASLAVCAALALVLRAHPETLFYGGRLNFPITYPNAQAAAMLIGYWPAVALAARRSGSVWLRALALGAATATLCGWMLSQSKGGAVGLIVSALVIFAVSSHRLRLLVPLAITVALAGAGTVPLTAPFRATTTPALRSAIHHGGAVLLLLTIAGTAAGLAYAFLDRRTDLSPAARRISGQVALVCTVLALVGVPLFFFATVEGPGSFVSHQWHALKHQPATETSGTHLLTLGSNRYDFWRVALQEFGRHPLIGIGSRGFGPAYLQDGRSQETPARAHSLPLDALSETGILGFALLLLIFVPPIAAVARRARGELTAAGVLAGGVYFVAHACVDWIWTIPAVGLLAMLLLSIGASSAAPAEPRVFARRASFLAAGAAVGLALIAFVPPWLASGYIRRADRGGAEAARDIVWAKRLDPLAIEPYVVQARWSGSAQAALVPLRQAVELQPSSVAARYLYGINLIKAGRPRAAYDQLAEADRLSPRDPYVNAALKRLPLTSPPR